MTSSAVVAFETWNTASVIDALSSGTRIASPLSLPCNWGKTSAIALAEPVEVGRQVAEARPRAAQVGLFRVQGVDDRLRVGHVVDGRDAPALDAEALEDDFDERREAVGGAGGSGDDGVVGVWYSSWLTP